MPIPEDILKQMKCCLSDDGHIVNEPVVLKCGSNACKKCASDLISVKCFGCNDTHEKKELMNAPINKIVNSFINLFLEDLFLDLKNKLKSTAELLKGFVLFYIKCH